MFMRPPPDNLAEAQAVCDRIIIDQFPVNPNDLLIAQTLVLIDIAHSLRRIRDAQK
jgi:hypothetical protein